MPVILTRQKQWKTAVCEEKSPSKDKNFSLSSHIISLIPGRGRVVDARRENFTPRGEGGGAHCGGDELKILIYLGKFEAIFQMV
jgi:hypothetical protein